MKTIFVKAEFYIKNQQIGGESFYTILLNPAKIHRSMVRK
jgi:hypothetical protein